MISELQSCDGLIAEDFVSEVSMICTSRETQVLHLFCAGWNMAEISRILNISAPRVRQLRESIARKIRRVHGRDEIRSALSSVGAYLPL